MHLTIIKNRGKQDQKILELLEGQTKNFLGGTFQVEVATLEEILKTLPDTSEEDFRKITGCKGNFWARIRFIPGLPLPDKFYHFEGYSPRQTNPGHYSVWRNLAQSIERFATLDEDIELIIVE